MSDIPYAAGASVTCSDGKHDICGGYVRVTHRCPCPCHRGVEPPSVTWKSEQERLACQCLRSDGWRCNNERRQRGTALGTIGCPCECHRYAHRQAAALDAAHPHAANRAVPKS